MESLAYSLYLESDLKLNSFKIFHYTNHSLSDTTWTDKKNKKKVRYQHNKLECGFSINQKLNLLFEANLMVDNDIDYHILLVNSDYVNNNVINSKFKVIETNTNDGFTIQREVNKLREKYAKNGVNIYCLIDDYKFNAPVLKFESDTLVGNGLKEIVYTTTTKLNKFVWENSQNQIEGSEMNPKVNIKVTQKVKVYYIDENNCKSDFKEITFLFKENCSCDTKNSIPEIEYKRSPNILEKDYNEEAEWEYKLIPEGASGSLAYEFAIKNVCAEKFLIQIN
jgi:hypothetical protein